ncbi:MAG: hypothetical protein IT366_02675 [Candidatus Hydrogenedentes bacterium]|nr:hypothetical protein [Candidatus Hydrogenedentota bacterium]
MSTHDFSGPPKGSIAKALVHGLCVLLALGLMSVPLLADTAYYMDSAGVVGLGSARKLAKAREKALQHCLENGGEDCELVGESTECGWSSLAVAYDLGGRTTATAFGQSSRKKARRKALKNCRALGGEDCLRLRLHEDTHCD